MPYFSDSRDLVGRADDCCADPFTNLVIQDASQWLKQDFGGDSVQPTIDVVFLDALEPGEEIYPWLLQVDRTLDSILKLECPLLFSSLFPFKVVSGTHCLTTTGSGTGTVRAQHSSDAITVIGWHP
jgi:hypothetical protein